MPNNITELFGWVSLPCMTRVSFGTLAHFGMHTSYMSTCVVTFNNPRQNTYK